MDQTKIHENTFSSDPKERIDALRQLNNNFDSLPRKKEAWDDIIRLTSDSNSEVQKQAVIAIDSVFCFVPEKIQCWGDIVTLLEDKEFDFKSSVAESLYYAFRYTPKEENVWDNLSKLAKNEEQAVRKNSARSLISAFQHAPNKTEAWGILHKLSSDIESEVRRTIAREIGTVFLHIPDKDQALEDLFKLSRDERSTVRGATARSLSMVFRYLPENQQKSVWDVLLSLMEEKSINVREKAIKSVLSEIEYLPGAYKKQAWEILHKLRDSDRAIQITFLNFIPSAFQYLPDKQQAWQDLIALIENKGIDIMARTNAVHFLGSAFQYVPDKVQAFDDIIRLTENDDFNIRRYASNSIGHVFEHISKTERAWKFLHELTESSDTNIRSGAAQSIGSVYPYLSDQDKEQALQDIIRLAKDDESSVRSEVAGSIGYAIQNRSENYENKLWDILHNLADDPDIGVKSSVVTSIDVAFEHLSDKEEAWNDLIKIITTGNPFLRSNSTVFSLQRPVLCVPDKNQAVEDLIKLANDENGNVRSNIIRPMCSIIRYLNEENKNRVFNIIYSMVESNDRHVLSEIALSLGYVYQYIPDKDKAFGELLRLKEDDSVYVRVSSNRSLGRISIFKASQAETEEEYEKELENAVSFFEKVAEIDLYNPFDFCLPFYRAFHTLIFKKQKEAKEEVDRYLAEAKEAIKGSESRELLFDAVENLANALKEVQNLENMDLEAKKDKLNFYRTHCEKASELMYDTEKFAPAATGVIRKGLPILDRKLKSLLEEIQEKAKTACRESQGTDTEEIACAVSREVQKWEIGSQEEMSWYVENLIFTLESNVPKAAENQPIFDKIEQIREEKVLVKQYAILCSIIPMIPNLHVKQAISGLAEEVRGVKEAFDTLSIALKPGIKEEIEISSGIEILGTGAKHIVTIPLQEISYDELKDDLKRIKGKHITKLSRLPVRLARKIKGYLLLHDREDLVEQLS